jgi:hypothetical protein
MGSFWSRAVKPHHLPKPKSRKVYIFASLVLLACGALWWMYKDGAIDPRWPIADARAVQREVLAQHGMGVIGVYYVGRVKVVYLVNAKQHEKWLEVTKGGSSEVQDDLDKEMTERPAHKLRYNPRNPDEAFEVVTSY